MTMDEVNAGELTPLFDNLYRLCAPNPSFMTGPGTNTYIYGKNELAVFDPGPVIDEHVSSILNAQDQLNAPITRIFVTHTHSDHSPATSLLAKQLPNAELIGIEAPKGQAYEDETFSPHITPKDDQSFSIEGQSVKAVHTPGHVSNHLCYLFEEHDFLITGDHLMNGSTVVIIPPKGVMLDYIESLRKLLLYQITSMGPGHGPVIDNPVELVEHTIAHRLKREDKVISALKQVAESTIKDLVPVVYDDTPKNLHGMAALSLHAHLIKLETESRATVENELWSLLI